MVARADSFLSLPAVRLRVLQLGEIELEFSRWLNLNIVIAISRELLGLVAASYLSWLSWSDRGHFDYFAR